MRRSTVPAAPSGGVDPGLAGQLSKLPQVQAATGVAIGLAKINGKVEQVSAVDPHAASQIFNVSPVQGSLAALSRNGIAVHKDVATASHLRLGSTIPVLFKDIGRQNLTVALIYGEATGAPAPRYFMGNQAFDANFSFRYDSQVFVKKAPGVSTAAALAAVSAVADRYSGHGCDLAQPPGGEAERPSRPRHRLAAKLVTSTAARGEERFRLRPMGRRATTGWNTSEHPAPASRRPLVANRELTRLVPKVAP